MQGKVYKRITNIEREEISRSLATGKAVAELQRHYEGTEAMFCGKYNGE